jgi:hypothetical protein
MVIKRIKKSKKKHFQPPRLFFLLPGEEDENGLPGRRPFPMSKKLSDNCYKRRRKEKKKDPPFSLSLSAIPPTAFWGLETGPDEG